MNRRTRDAFYLLWTLAILNCLAICVFLLVWFSFAKGGGSPAADAVPSPDPAQQQAEGVQPEDGQQPVLPGDGQQPAGEGVQEGTPVQEVQPSAAPTAPPVTLAETADMGQEYQDRLIFLGDSTTYGLYAYGLLPHTQVWTPASGTLSLFNWAVESIDYYAPGAGDASQSLPIIDCAATAQPEYLVITLGINGVSLLDESQFRGYYVDLVQGIQYASPNTKIMCQSIYPVIDAQAPEGIDNARINAANGWIQDIAAQLGVRYLNTHDALLDQTGNLSLDYISPESDGIHMDARGYTAILQYIRTHAWQ